MLYFGHAYFKVTELNRLVFVLITMIESHQCTKRKVTRSGAEELEDKIYVLIGL